MTYIDQIRQKIKNPKYISCLTEEMIWMNHDDTMIWEADSFQGKPFFYNVYKYKNYYSYSILALILFKNNLKINQRTLDAISNPLFSNHSGNYTIDEEIEKIGAPHPCSFEHNDVDEYVKLVSDALVKDVKLIEGQNPEKTNIIMCGGRDSLNLLFLPWENPVIALSADPNYRIVKEFIENNGLNIPLRKVEDPIDELKMNDEVLEACCRADLTHWRWTTDLCNVADEYNRNAIIWKGQLGDIYLAHDWKNFITPFKEPQRFFRRSYKKFSYLFPQFIHTWVGHYFQPVVIRRVWEVCSSLQGGHMSFLRGILDMLVLSAYHGPNVSKVIAKADLGIVAQNDIRPKIGKYLLGRDVIYADENPYPKVSEFRKDLHKPEKFANLLKNSGVEVTWP